MVCRFTREIGVEGRVGFRVALYHFALLLVGPLLIYGSTAGRTKNWEWLGERILLLDYPLFLFVRWLAEPTSLAKGVLLYLTAVVLGSAVYGGIATLLAFLVRRLARRWRLLNVDGESA